MFTFISTRFLEIKHTTFTILMQCNNLSHSNTNPPYTLLLFDSFYSFLLLRVWHGVFEWEGGVVWTWKLDSSLTVPILVRLFWTWVKTWYSCGLLKQGILVLGHLHAFCSNSLTGNTLLHASIYTLYIYKVWSFMICKVGFGNGRYVYFDQLQCLPCILIYCRAVATTYLINDKNAVFCHS